MAYLHYPHYQDLHQHLTEKAVDGMCSAGIAANNMTSIGVVADWTGVVHSSEWLLNSSFHISSASYCYVLQEK